MHNYNENTLLPDKYRERQIANNFNTLADYVTFDHYNIWIPAVAFVDTTGIAPMTARSAIAEVPVKSYPIASPVRSAFAFRKPSMWVNGRISMRLWYTSDLDAGKTWTFKPAIFASSEGAALGAWGGLESLIVPSPAGGGYLTIDRQCENLQSPYSYLVSEMDNLISVRLQKVSQTHKAEFQLIGVEVFYVENTASVIGMNRSKNFRHVSKP